MQTHTFLNNNLVGTTYTSLLARHYIRIKQPVRQEGYLGIPKLAEILIITNLI